MSRNYHIHSAHFLLLLLFNLFGTASAFAKDLEVCATCEYTSVKKAVEAAEDGDRVLVRQGTYQENDITIRNRISLIGLGNPVLDAGNKNGILTIENTEGVLIEGFTLRNVEVSYRKDFAAIKVFRSNHCIVRNNQIENTFFGIQLEKSDHAEVSGNFVKGQAEKEASSGNAIHLWYCNNALIKNNQLQGHRDGIYLSL